MLRRYQNEGMILLALLLLVAAMFYKGYRHTKLQTSSAEATEMVSKIEDIATMKKLWQKNSTVAQKLNAIKTYLPAIKIKTLQIEKKKAHVLLEGLNGNELNSVAGKYLASIPVQIVEMSIRRDGEYYRLELQCKW